MLFVDINCYALIISNIHNPFPMCDLPRSFTLAIQWLIFSTYQIKPSPGVILDHLCGGSYVFDIFYIEIIFT